MDEILGEHNTDPAFARYLASWHDIMDARVESAAIAFARVPDISGLILAGSNGARNPWPLSDIDLIPIFAEASLPAALETIEHMRVSMFRAWSKQGWRTGLDVGRLYFTDREAASVRHDSDLEPLNLMEDNRWYFAIDKAFQGKALFDSTGDTAALIDWLTAHRFCPEIVAFRLDRTARECARSLESAREHAAAGNRIAALSHQLKAVQWFQINRMESWGERDNSLGRFGTRFEREAMHRDAGELCQTLDALCALDDFSVVQRLGAAPAWVHERRRRSWDARRAVGESITALQNDRDVLRVCTIYELRVVTGEPYAEWLAVPDADRLAQRLLQVDELFHHQ